MCIFVAAQHHDDDMRGGAHYYFGGSNDFDRLRETNKNVPLVFISF